MDEKVLKGKIRSKIYPSSMKRNYSLFLEYSDGQIYSIQNDQFMTNKRGEKKLAAYGTWYRHVSSPAMGSQGRLGRLLRPVLPDG
jgi:hypothetical protein